MIMARVINNTWRRSEAGYTLLMALFLVASMLILASAAVPDLLTEGRRERERELMWRGNQYKRAIGLYYRAFGRFPTSIEDLTKLTNGQRFLRKAYRDPMNKQDGSWRFIYVGPNGQLIGSHRQMSVLQTLLSGIHTGGTSGSTNQKSSQKAAPGSAASGTQSSNLGLSPNPLESQPQPFGGTVMGGNIVGVGSKIKEHSLHVYDGADEYDQWEFIWSPTQQLVVPGGMPAAPGPPPPNQPKPPSGQAPGTASPTSNPAPGPEPGTGTNLPQVPQIPPS